MLAMEMVGKPGERRFYAELLALLGAPQSPRADIVQMEQAALRLLKAVGVQVIWKMLAVMPSVTCKIRRSDLAVSTVGLRKGVLRRMEDTRVSNCSFAAQRLIEISSKRLASWTSPLIASRASVTPKQTSEI